MQRLNTRWWVLLVIALVLGLALVACGGDDGDNKNEGDGDQPVPDQLPTDQTVPEQPTLDPAEATDMPSVASESMATPFAPLPELAYNDAVDTARADLAVRLDVRPVEIEALSAESEVLLGQPALCPALPDVELDLYYVYLQYKRFIYPYQVYLPADPSAAMVVEACEDVFIDEEVLYIPTPDSRVAISDLVVADLIERGVDTTQGAFQLVREMTWTDANLGCPILPGQDAPQTVIQAGFLMLYEVNGITYEYHTDDTGDQVVYCEPPPGYATPADLIAALQEDEAAAARIVEDEVARVEGLTGEGTLVALTDFDYLIGVFGFGSTEQARAAATLITDTSVWRAFVSDQVLIVLYDASPPAYSLLLKYSDEVDLPAQPSGDPTPDPAADGA
ncbi:MAG: hypothetical protein JXA10_06950 [Anaerolineae bacterium]|nr:hypothetical protein [Anaerolineae bacterium]